MQSLVIMIRTALPLQDVEVIFNAKSTFAEHTSIIRTPMVILLNKSEYFIVEVR